MPTPTLAAQALESGSVLKIMWPLLKVVVTLLVVGAVVSSLGYLFRKKKRARGGGSVPMFPRASSLLTPAELAFYRVLREAILPASPPTPNGGPLSPTVLSHCLILFKVRLEDLLEVPKDTRFTDRNSIKSRHADFVLADATTTRPLLVIELDDASHQRQQTRKADAIKNEVLAKAGLPLLRVRGSGKYSVEEVRGRVDEMLSPSETLSRQPSGLR